MVLLAALLAGCGGSPTSPTPPTDIVFEFFEGPQGWVTGFADYRAGQEMFMELDAGYRTIPAPIGPGRSAHFLSGNNRTDDLFMFLKRHVIGLHPDTSYRATFVVQLATDVQVGCIGIGGSPGESVHLKAGMSTVEPVAVDDGSGTLRMSVDKGDQANPGAAAVVLGTIEGTMPCLTGPRMWELKTLDSGFDGVTARSTAQGDLWVFTGTDSGFEGTTSLYVTRFSARLQEGQ